LFTKNKPLFAFVDIAKISRKSPFVLTIIAYRDTITVIKEKKNGGDGDVKYSSYRRARAHLFSSQPR
jgi:hypothetical protein